MIKAAQKYFTFHVRFFLSYEFFVLQRMWFRTLRSRLKKVIATIIVCLTTNQVMRWKREQNTLSETSSSVVRQLCTPTEQNTRCRRVLNIFKFRTSILHSNKFARSSCDCLRYPTSHIKHLCDFHVILLIIYRNTKHDWIILVGSAFKAGPLW